MKKIIRLTESDLSNMIAETVKIVLGERFNREDDEDDLFDGTPHTYQVEIFDKGVNPDGRFADRFENISSWRELENAVRGKYPKLLHWVNPRKIR